MSEAPSRFSLEWWAEIAVAGLLMGAGAATGVLLGWWAVAYYVAIFVIAMVAGWWGWHPRGRSGGSDGE